MLIFKFCGEWGVSVTNHTQHYCPSPDGTSIKMMQRPHFAALIRFNADVGRRKSNNGAEPVTDWSRPCAAIDPKGSDPIGLIRGLPAAPILLIFRVTSS